MTLSRAELAHLADVARMVAREAGEILTIGFRSRPNAEKKSQNDLVTEFDRRSQDHLLARLAELSPDVPVVAEEELARGPGTAAPAASGPVWYVDPLDGTTNFVHGHPFWCVSVGLLDEGEPAVGVVIAPKLECEWSGYLCNEGGEALRNREPCGVSRTEDLADAMIGTGFPPVRDVAPDNNFDSFVSVKKVARAVRRCGSAAIDLCFVADGTYDGYWERRLHAWDVAAGATLVRAAGGLVTSLSGGRPDWSRGHLVATNGRIHDELVRVVGAG